jgi:hypothetical protein
MILCEWDAPEGDPGQSCVHLFARILSTSFTSVSIFSVCCYSSVSISMVNISDIRKTPDIGLASYSTIPLRLPPRFQEHYHWSRWGASCIL